jgi:hypothetical protein
MTKGHTLVQAHNQHLFRRKKNQKLGLQDIEKRFHDPWLLLLISCGAKYIEYVSSLAPGILYEQEAEMSR